MRLSRKEVLLITSTAFSFILCFTVSGQSVNENYQSEAIYLRGNKYVKNGKEFPIGFWGQHLKKEMTVSKDAVLEYDKFERKVKIAFIFRAISTATLVSAIFVENTDLQSGMLYGGFGLGIVSVPISAGASNHAHKAIWLRNGAILE